MNPNAQITFYLSNGTNSGLQVRRKCVLDGVIVVNVEDLSDLPSQHPLLECDQISAGFKEVLVVGPGGCTTNTTARLSQPKLLTLFLPERISCPLADTATTLAGFKLSLFLFSILLLYVVYY